MLLSVWCERFDKPGKVMKAPLRLWTTEGRALNPYAQESHNCGVARVICLCQTSEMADDHLR